MKKTKITMLTLVVFASIGAAFASNNPFVTITKYYLNTDGTRAGIASANHVCTPGTVPCTADFDDATGTLVEVPNSRVLGVYVP